MSHTITVTELPNDQSDDVVYSISGTHDPLCEVWRPCSKDWHRHPKDADMIDDEWSTKRAGLHQFIDGEWMVPSEGCGFRYALADMGAEFDEQVTRGGLGDYDVEIEWDGDGWSAYAHRKSTDSWQEPAK